MFLKSSLVYFFFMDIISLKIVAEVLLNFGEDHDDSVLLNLIKEIEVELIQKFNQKCNNLNLIFDTNSIKDELNLNAESSIHSTVVILSLNPKIPPSCLNDFQHGELPPPDEHPFASCSSLVSMKFSIKFPPPCSLIIISIHPQEKEIANLHINYHLWPFIKFPGFPFQIFYLFLVQDTPEEKNVEMSQLKIDLLSNFSMTTKKIQHALYFIKNTGNLLARSNSNDFVLILAGHLNDGSLKVTSSDYSGLYQRKKKYRDFNGDKILVVIYPIATNYEVSKETGAWEDYIIATMYFTALPFNVTMELESAFDIPKDGVTEDGQWDVFMIPILDGSAVFSAILRATTLNTPFAHFSKPVIYDGAIFISALPKRTRPASVFSVLTSPLSFEIWIGSAIALILTFIVLEAIFCTNTTKNRDHYRIIVAILNPVIEQSGLSRYCRVVIKDSTSRSILGLWFLSLIVLGCGYKSSLFDIIVSPRYSKPPTTFIELMNSDYEIGGLSWTNFLELDFDSLLLKDHGNISMGREISKRITEYDFTTPDCYLSIFDGKKTCIGFSTLFTSLALEYTVDVNGRFMHMYSEEKYFTIFPSIATSKNFPDFSEPLNRIIGLVEAHGLSKHWLSRSQARLRAKGKSYAKRWVEKKPHYKGSGTSLTEQEDGEDRRQFGRLLQTICKVGCGISTISFILELCWMWWRNKHRMMTVEPLQSDPYGFVM